MTELLIRRSEQSEEASPLARLIEQATQGMEGLIDSLLRRAEAGQSELKEQPVSLQQVVDAVRLSLHSIITSADAQIVCSSLPIVNADATQMRQLFQDLVGNAIKYHRLGVTPTI